MTRNPKSDIRTPQLRHISILCREAVDLLAPKSGGVYVDGTLGAGGHAIEILRRSAPDGILIGIDQDVDALVRCKANLALYSERVYIRQENFRNIAKVLSDVGYQSVDGVLLDLGVSLYHLKSSERGFSFLLDGPLDMRMDRSNKLTAADLVNNLSRKELSDIIWKYGEERRAGIIAKAIDEARILKPITGTLQLADIISGVIPLYAQRRMRIHPATLTFQALRIAVNDELGALRSALSQIITHVKPGGRIVIITFHSLEDRIVKQTFVQATENCICPHKMPVCTCGKKPELKILTRRPVEPALGEITLNPASRSAKLRAAEKI